MLADLLNEAAILAARRSGELIQTEDLHGGWLKVAVGTSRRRSMDERERSIIAAHEVGHAICSKVHGDKRRVEEISLFAHGEALGVTVSSQEDNDLPSESDLRARLVALMGGRAAEEILFHEVTGGASNDFEAANKIAVAMVTRWGMGQDPEASDHGVSGRGSLSFLVPLPGGRSLPSDVQAAATRAIRSILDGAYAEACRTLIDNMDTLRRLAAYLVEHERVDGDTFDELFDGRRVVQNAGDEWRAATARPRAWGEVVDLAAHRVRPAPTIAAVVAAELEASAITGAQVLPAAAPARANVASIAARQPRATPATPQRRPSTGTACRRLAPAAERCGRGIGACPQLAALDRARGRPALSWFATPIWYRHRSCFRDVLPPGIPEAVMPDSSPVAYGWATTKHSSPRTPMAIAGSSICTCAKDVGNVVARIQGAAGSTVLVGLDQLTVCRCGGPSLVRRVPREPWSYDDLGGASIGNYGSLPVILLQLSHRSDPLPILILERGQVGAALDGLVTLRRLIANSAQARANAKPSSLIRMTTERKYS